MCVCVCVCVCVCDFDNQKVEKEWCDMYIENV